MFWSLAIFLFTFGISTGSETNSTARDEKGKSQNHKKIINVLFAIKLVK